MTTSQRAKPREEFVHIEWLGQVVLCTGVQPRHPVSRITECRQDKRRGVNPAAAEPAQKIQPVDHRQPSVQDQDIKIICQREVESLLAISGYKNLVTFREEQLVQHPAQLRVILHQKKARLPLAHSRSIEAAIVRRSLHRFPADLVNLRCPTKVTLATVESGVATWLAWAMSTTSPSEPSQQHSSEPHRGGLSQRLNWLRAGVLGANDGIVSVAALVVGVAGATTASAPILTAGVAGLVGGAVSMALGEYVSVSSQRDSERALIAKERQELIDMPEQELAELAGIYQAKGLKPETAKRVAEELSAHDALAAHLSAELNIEESDVVSPWHAAFVSAAAFTIGGALPLVAILLPPASARVAVTFAAVLVALAITGAVGARIGGSSRLRATLRVVIGGALALAITFAIGTLLGATGVV